MLNSYQAPGTISEKLALFEQACRSAGLKLTHQRREIFRELARAKDHPSAETLYKRLLKRLPTISLDTVYRTLGSLEKQGVIRRVDTRESQARFEAETLQHHHLICTRCGEIVDFQWESFDRSELPPELQGWGQLNYRSISLHGICSKCLKDM